MAQRTEARWFVVNFCLVPRGGGYIEHACFVDANDHDAAAQAGMELIDFEVEELDEGYASSVYVTELGETVPFHRASTVKRAPLTCCSGGSPSGHSAFCPNHPREEADSDA